MRIVALSLAVLLAACSASPQRPRDYYARLLAPTAKPSEVVATELAFARRAQEKGQWTAFREFATGDATMFVPEPVNAQEWLKKRTDPSEAVKWQPHEVWSSCDGSLAVTRGAWQRPNGTHGYFTTVWERQKNGEYKWVMDQGDVLAEPLIAPEFIRTVVAECQRSNMFVQADGPKRQFFGESADGTLSWNVNVRDDNARDLAVYVNSPAGMDKVLELAVAAPTQ
ncbi:hypothetical protein [Qipengyuania sp. RANM35]|uniref:hypothetical protein n=1 Tax=Qipengyuania sp. RANM35 TaxID=3068635 RepID=UPI0034DB093F